MTTKAIILEIPEAFHKTIEDYLTKTPYYQNINEFIMELLRQRIVPPQSSNRQTIKDVEQRLAKNIESQILLMNVVKCELNDSSDLEDAKQRVAGLMFVLETTKKVIEQQAQKQLEKL